MAKEKRAKESSPRNPRLLPTFYTNHMAPTNFKRGVKCFLVLKIEENWILEMAITEGMTAELLCLLLGKKEKESGESVKYLFDKVTST